MSWRRDWPERRPRPKVKKLSDDGKEEILAVFRMGIETSPVLSDLGIRVRVLRSRFYFERVWESTEDELEVEIIGRVTPLLENNGELLLEIERTKGNWHEVVWGKAKKVVNRIANDKKGTFHGLGDLDEKLRKAGNLRNRQEVQMLDDYRFAYVQTGEECTFHEAMYHYFGVPIPVIAEPRHWYYYCRKPHIVEVSEDNKQILVVFTAYGVMGAFSGVCLYAKIGDEWESFRIKPNQSGDISTAIAWLEKQEWREWRER